MARKPEGFTLHRDERTRYWIARFTHNGQRYKRSTRERDRSSAQEIASRIVGEVTQGRVVSVARAPTLAEHSNFKGPLRFTFQAT